MIACSCTRVGCSDSFTSRRRIVADFFNSLLERLVTDDLRSYAPAARDLGIEHLHERGRWKTTGPRIRVSRPDGGSARCNALRAPAPRRDCSQRTPPCTTLLTFNAISRQPNHTACSA